MSDGKDARVLVAASVAAMGTLALAYYLLRSRRLSTQRASLIQSTVEPLLTEGEQALIAEQPVSGAELPLDFYVSEVAQNLADVRERLSTAATAAGRSDAQPRLVAVSKTKPIDMVHEAYAAGQRHFGENYVQELVSKAPQVASDVRWHFIGGLQSNKAKELVKGAGNGLAVVETVDSAKLAEKLNAAVEGLETPRPNPLDVLIQVNTSPWEGSKGGVLVADVLTLAMHIRSTCPRLRLAGLMTIGAPQNTSCFTTLCECRDELAKRLRVPPRSLELSMGMSGDFEAAIAAGSDSVRVGSSIFGQRDYSASKKK